MNSELGNTVATLKQLSRKRAWTKASHHGPNRVVSM